MTSHAPGNPRVDVRALPMGEFTFPEGGDYAGQTGLVVAYAIRHQGGVFLFDTGFGSNSELAEYYKVRARALPDELVTAGVDLAEITAVANCHLHADHSGQNGLFPGIPIYVQPAEWAAAHEPDYTVIEDIDFPGARYEQVAGDHEVAPGIRVSPRPAIPPATSRSSSRPRMARCSSPARRCTATASGAGSRARARASARRRTSPRTPARSRGCAP